MNAEEARKKYFENYVESEWEIKKLVDLIKVNSSFEYVKFKKTSISLSYSIMCVDTINKEKSLGIKVKYFWGQKDVQNWLAHSKKQRMVLLKITLEWN